MGGCHKYNIFFILGHNGDGVGGGPGEVIVGGEG